MHSDICTVILLASLRISVSKVETILPNGVLLLVTVTSDLTKRLSGFHPSFPVGRVDENNSDPSPPPLTYLLKNPPLENCLENIYFSGYGAHLCIVHFFVLVLFCKIICNLLTNTPSLRRDDLL